MILNGDRFCHSRPLLLDLRVLSVYQINLYQHLTFMRRRKINDIPELFDEVIKNTRYKYPNNLSNLNNSIKKYSLETIKYSVSFRGLTL